MLCDIETPDSLKEKFSEFGPIFKNAKVSRENISPLMRDFAEKTITQVIQYCIDSLDMNCCSEYTIQLYFEIYTD